MRIETSGGLLVNQKRVVFSGLAKRLLDSQERLFFIELVVVREQELLSPSVHLSAFCLQS
jgi:hypothetical protein